MKKLTKKYICVFVALCILTSCNSSKPHRSYKVGEALDTGIMYVAVNSVTQKENLRIDEKEYLPKDGDVYLIFDISMKSERDKGYNFDNARYAYTSGALKPYILNKELSQLVSNLKDSEWSAFTSVTEKKIQLVFEGPETPENMKSETFYLEQPFVIYKEDIVVE